jgi:hypothetical protein
MQGQHRSSAGQLQELAVCFLVYRTQSLVASSLQKVALTGVVLLLLVMLSICNMMSRYAVLCYSRKALTAVCCFNVLLYFHKCNSYAFVALGELPAFIAGWCLTLEFGVSGSAVAVSASSISEQIVYDMYCKEV